LTHLNAQAPGESALL